MESFKKWCFYIKGSCGEFLKLLIILKFNVRMIKNCDPSISLYLTIWDRSLFIFCRFYQFHEFFTTSKYSKTDMKYTNYPKSYLWYAKFSSIRWYSMLHNQLYWIISYSSSTANMHTITEPRIMQEEIERPERNIYTNFSSGHKCIVPH